MSSAKQTKEKLKGLPFKSAKEMNTAQQEIALDNWKRLTRYTDFNSQINKQEFKEVKEEFETGFMCGYSPNGKVSPDDSGDVQLLRVFKASRGVQIKIKEKKATDPQIVSKLASDMALAFGTLYYEVSGLKVNDPNESNSAKRMSVVAK